MRESMAQLTPRFSASRAVCDYTERHYLPAANAFHSRHANQGALGRQMVDWHNNLAQKWPGLHFGEVTVDTQGDHHNFAAQIFLPDLDPAAVRLELYANGPNDGAPFRQEMKQLRPIDGAAGGWIYAASVPANRPAADFTARVIPRFDGIAIPLEDARILWQR